MADVSEVWDGPQHLEGLQVDNAITFQDWRHPKFLATCAKHKGGQMDDGRPWFLGVVNGCFDLFHLGHMNLIAQAVSYQATGRHVFLVALLNSDASVGRLKGLHRPYVPLPARLCMVAMQQFVEGGAAGFDEDTPEEALSVLRPDFLFKGAEYEGKSIPGAEHCGKVVFLPETPGFRTTDLERRIVAAAGGSVQPPRTGT